MLRFYAFIFFFFVVKITSAQEGDALLITRNDRIRISFEDSSKSYGGRLITANAGVISLSLRDEKDLKSFDLETIDKIEIYRGKKNYEAILGGSIGFLIGGGIGLLVGGSSSTSTVGENGADAIDGAKIGALGGAILGAVLGGVSTGEKWEEISKESILEWGRGLSK